MNSKDRKDHIVDDEPTHQIVKVVHGALDFAYAWSESEARETMRLMGDNTHILDKGNFIPDNEEDDN